MTAQPDATAEAASLMLRFAERSGLTSEREQRRYLWTDAFAVCNFLGLARATRDARHAELALSLVDRVHHVLGRHRADDRRTGWISGLGEEEGELHPTSGGLRIGKQLPERTPRAPFDERLEWDRDGQYFHYLTKWMHALDQVSRATREPRYNTWARELAAAAHRSFTAGTSGRERRLAWKLSIDLSRPLVASMGHHDPLDGFITCIQLRTTAAMLPGAPSAPDLTDALADFASLMHGREWATADPLGLGGLLMDAHRVDQLTKSGAFSGGALRDTLLAAALEGLARYSRSSDLREAASRRLAFRELGLAVGLSASARIQQDAPEAQADPASVGAPALSQAVSRYRALGSAIESFWRAPEHRDTIVWGDHRDINEVMLATCLAPDGLLVLG